MGRNAQVFCVNQNRSRTELPRIICAMSYKPTISFTPAGMDACALWRMFIPHLNTPTSRFFFTMGAVPFDQISSSDVGCVQRMMIEGNIKYMELARSHGVRMIYD